MRRRRFLASPLLLVASGSVAAVEDFPGVVPGYRLEFPRDLGSHPSFRNEWWYVTGWLRGTDDNDLGIQVTFFRNRPRVAEASRSQFAARQLLFAHAAIADPRHGRLRHEQRAARAGFGLAEASERGTDVRIGDWSLRFAEGSYQAQVAAEEFRLDLRFTPVQPVLLQGDQGYSRKGRDADHASYYYSQPQLVVAGSVATDGRSTDVRGIAWLDHEWSSQGMAAEASGWDWVGVNLHDGGSLMAFRMRDRAGNAVWAGGMLRTADGTLTRFEPGDVSFSATRRWRSPRTGVEYPVAMRVRAGSIDCALDPLMDDQELDSRTSTGTIYWEGAVRMLRDGHEVGRGYLELTGYWKPLKL